MKTYLFDTNYILRLLLKDNLNQYRHALLYVQKAKKKQIILIIPNQAIFEANYILAKIYQLPKSTIVSSLMPFIVSTYITVDNRLLLSKSLFLYETHNFSLIDIYFSLVCNYNSYTLLTFDKKLLSFHNKTIREQY